jgi:hypothetical protein
MMLDLEADDDELAMELLTHMSVKPLGEYGFIVFE